MCGWSGWKGSSDVRATWGIDDFETKKAAALGELAEATAVSVNRNAR